MKTQFPEYGILYIDDEMKSLKYFEAIFDTLAPIYIANSPEEGFELFQKHHERIGVVMSDSELASTIDEKRTGRSAWRFLMIAALVFLLLECLLADRMLNKARNNSEPLPQNA